MKKLYAAILKRVNPEEDSVRLYWITPDSFQRSLAIGHPPLEEPPSFYIV